MKSTYNVLLGAAVSLYAGTSSAITSAYTPSGSDMSIRWAVPETAVSSGSGDVYFQITAPTKYQWVGVGIGSRMQGAQIFLVYQDGSGNVTLSTRTGQGHVMPQYSQRSAELIEGSGVQGGNMVANVVCRDCSSLSLSGRNSWISAWKEGSSLDSTSTSQRIDVHDDESSYTVDFSQAAFSSSGSPFADGATSSNPGSNSGSGSGSGSGDDDSGSGDDKGGSSGGSDDSSEKVLLAHGIIMSIVFVALYPIGSILMPLIGRWLIHAGWQTLAFLGMWAGFALGYIYAKDNGYWFNNTHTRLGTIVVALIGIQPVLGFLHHSHFKKNQQRGLISHFHIWYGRILMVLGIINGGLGLQLASSSMGYVVAYSVVAGVIFIAYVGAIFLGARKKERRQKIISPQMTQEEQYSP